MPTYSPQYLTYMGKGPSRIVHWEHWSCPDAETYLTGIDYFQNPLKCRERMWELYPCLGLGIPESDAPIARPSDDANKDSHTVRWGDSTTATWEHGEAFFKTPEDVFAFSPLAHADMRGWGHVVEALDYSSEQVIYDRYRNWYPEEWGNTAPEGDGCSVGFYNTMFMWPMLTFGWELFLECCLDPRFERVMDEFAELNRRVFRSFAKLPVNFVVCHDDIVMTNGPVCSPAWMKKYIFPRYEEFWGMVKAAGKEVIFMVDGCIDAYADDIFACGARGIISEPYTNYKALARKYKDCFIAGEGDNRILDTGDKDLIKKMVLDMAETGKMSGGYMMCIGNHIPWNVNPEGIKWYLEYSNEYAFR